MTKIGGPNVSAQECERCGEWANVTIMSMFNTQTICMECKEKERAHPDYKKACEADHQAIVGGNYNFPGIGLPEDLQGGRK